MNNEMKKKLAIELLIGNEEHEIVNILKKYNLWEDSSLWKNIGGENTLNTGTTNNQQQNSINALVEKLVNSTDAILMKECIKKNIDPESKYAPQSPVEARINLLGMKTGKLSHFSEAEIKDVAKNIHVYANGHMLTPSITIVDNGEGQEPENFEDTFLSLNRSNKNRIPFLQGKYGMGGTGVYRFCSEEHRLSMILSRRCHEFENKKSDEWGITIIRRFKAIEGEKLATYKYLTFDNKIISFSSSEGLPVLPVMVNGSYEFNLLKSGTIVKFYDFAIDGKGASNKKRGKLKKAGTRLTSEFQRWPARYIQQLLPDTPLPFNACDLRYPKEAVRAIPPLVHNLYNEEQKGIIEYTESGNFYVSDEKLSWKIYLFNDDNSGFDKDKSWRRHCFNGEPISWVYNGQTMTQKQRNFFGTRGINLNELKESIIVLVDFSEITPQLYEEIFLASRDRNAENDLSYEIYENIADILKNNEKLKRVKRERINALINNKIDNSKTLTQLFEEIVNNDSALAELFGSGEHFAPTKNIEIIEGKEYVGKPHPTYFHLSKGNEFPKDNPRIVEKERSMNLKFDTDVEVHYFNRDINQGEMKLYCNEHEFKRGSIRIADGIAYLKFEIDNFFDIGQIYKFDYKVSDETIAHKPFLGSFYINVIEFQDKQKTNSEIKKRKFKNTLAIPQIVPVYEDQLEKHGMDHLSAIKISKTDEDKLIIFCNMTNVYLKNKIKSEPKKKETLENQFMIGLTIFACSIYRSIQEEIDSGDQEIVHNQTAEEVVEKITRRIAQTIHVLISLGNFSVISKMGKELSIIRPNDDIFEDDLDNDLHNGDSINFH